MARKQHRLSKAYYAAIASLREKCPVSGGEVRVKRRPIRSGALGDCNHYSKPDLEQGGYFMIRILNSLGSERAIETLIHEWAHAMVWFSPAAENSEGDHHSEWGVAYARCYRVIFED